MTPYSRTIVATIVRGDQVLRLQSYARLSTAVRKHAELLVETYDQYQPGDKVEFASLITGKQLYLIELHANNTVIHHELYRN